MMLLVIIFKTATSRRFIGIIKNELKFVFQKIIHKQHLCQLISVNRTEIQALCTGVIRASFSMDTVKEASKNG